VFVVGDEEAAALGEPGFGRAPYETMCEDHVCSEVSTALFITRSTLESPDALYRALIVGLGIDPTGGTYPEGHPSGVDSPDKK
jgi:hypothetical protein